MDNTTIAAGDLAINGTATGVDITTGATTNGLFMEKAFNAKTVIEATDPDVSVNLTTLYGGGAVGADTLDGSDTNFDFDLNGVNITVAIPDGTGQAGVATLIATAVNAAKDLTGVEAVVGEGATNGGALNAIVFRNLQKGDESAITVAVNDPGSPGDADLGFASFSEAADIDNNTGEISLSSAMSFALTSPNHPDDTILANLGLDGGATGFADVAGDGTVRYGAALAAGDLTINGSAIAATADDGLSTIYADASAAAKAKAINDLADTTGVTADFTPVYRTAGGSAIAGTLRSGDLVINGYDIFDGTPVATNANPSTVIAQDTDNTILNAINAKAGSTGIVATRDSDGIITLAARDGRNLHIKTSANGENITHLNGAAADTPASTVYFGTVQLASAHQFFVETTPIGTAPDIYEPGLEALGLGGGTTFTGEGKDVADDGQLQVITIQKKEGSVRYAGDPDHALAIKVGAESTLEVAKNGKSAVVDTGIFSTLKQFEDALRGQNFSTVTGLNKATDITVMLDSGNTGLEQQFKSFANGAISITVTDRSYFPPRDFTMNVGVDTATDSPSSIAGKINGIPGMTAAWSADGALKLETSDTDRYSFTYADTSGFLDMTGITHEQMQVQGIGKAITDFDTVMENMTSQISDFGARANRIIVQQQIYSNLELSTTENLSEKEDTDLVEALLALKGKETAYEAALSAAAKTMQLSLVDFLK
jgi:flagellin-like hook-associated protein FlgL